MFYIRPENSTILLTLPYSIVTLSKLVELYPTFYCNDRF